MKISFFRILYYIVLTAIICTPFTLRAQTVKATLDTNIVEIGGQPILSLKLTVNQGKKVKPPTFKSNQIVPTLEVVTTLKPDTMNVGLKEVTYTFPYVITSFEDSTYTIPNIPVLIDDDTLYSNELKVMFTKIQGVDSTFTAEIDTTQIVRIFDIREIKETPWTFAEFWARFGNTILIMILVALLASLITWIVIRKIRNQPIIPISKPKEPADKVAIRRLNALKDKQLCQADKYKEFYTELTDIVKEYISDLYGISVMESTTQETLQILDHQLKHSTQERKSENHAIVKNILDTADFVKFAKMSPLQDENDKCLSDAYIFVDETKQYQAVALGKHQKIVVPTPGFFETVKDIITKHYFDFNGRARRSDYWWFALAFWLVFILGQVLIAIFNNLFGAIGGYIGLSLLAIAILAMLIPLIAVHVRRKHDTLLSKPRKLLLWIPIVGQIVAINRLAQDSDSEPNEYGASSKYPYGKPKSIYKKQN